MRRFLGILIALSSVLVYAQGVPHLIYGTAQNSDGTPIPDGCGRFVAYQYPAGADTITQDSPGCDFSGSDWAVQIADLELSDGDTLAIWLFNACNGETARVLVEVDMDVPAQNVGMVTLQAGLPVITVTYPNGGESFMFGSGIDIQWMASDMISTVNIYFSSDGGATWTTVATGVSASLGVYHWTAPSEESHQCLIKVVSAADTSVYDVSDGYFEIVPSPQIELTSPVGGETFYWGDTINIAWEGRAIAGVEIYFSSDGGTTWELVADGLPVSGTYDWAAPEISSSQCVVRVWASDDHSVEDMSGFFTIAEPPDTIPPAPITDLSADTVEPTRVYLSWTVTGDDGYEGIASVVDLRYYNEPITDANWDLCTPVDGEPVPDTSGTVAGMWVEGLAPGNTYYFACKIADEVPNWSGLSNVVEVTLPEVPDTVPPGAFTLYLNDRGCYSVNIGWLAPGDDGDEGVCDHYEFRYADFELNEDNFTTGTLISDVPAPAPAGTEQEITLDGLNEATQYWVAAYAYDDAGNRSPLTVLSFTTDTCTVPDTSDTTPPARITTLACQNFSPNGIQLTWMAPGDDDFVGRVAMYEIRYATHSFYSDEWETLAVDTAEMLPHEAGFWESYWVRGLESATEYWFAVFAIDDAGNRSEMSNLAHCYTMGVANPIADIYLQEDAPDTMIADLRDVFVPDSLVYGVDEGPGISTYFTGEDSSELWISLTPDFFGESYLYIYAYHGGYIVGDTVQVFVEHVNDPPFFTSGEPDTLAIPGILYQFNFTAIDPDGDSVWFFLVDGPDSMTVLADGTLLWTPPEYLSEGSYGVTVAVTDGEDTTTYDFSVYVTKITNPVFAPRNLVAYSGYLGSVPLRWDPPEAVLDGYPVHLVGYVVYRSTSADSGFALVGVSDMPTFNDASVDCGTVYYYAVRAVYDVPEDTSSFSNIDSGVCSSTSTRVFSTWTLHPVSVDGYIDEDIWQTGTVIEEGDVSFCFVNTADRLFGYIHYNGEISPGADFSMWFDDDNSGWWDPLPSDEGRFVFRYLDEIGRYFQPVADIGGEATMGTITSVSDVYAAWRETDEGVVVEFSVPLADEEHIGCMPGDSMGFMLTGADSTTDYFAWPSAGDRMNPSTYGELVLGAPSGIPQVTVYPARVEITVEEGASTTFQINAQNLGDAVGYFEVTSAPEWITPDFEPDFIYPMDIRDLQFTVNTAGMAVGDYSGELVIYATNPHGSSHTVEVILHVIEGEPSHYLVISVPSVTHINEDVVRIPVSVGQLYDNEITRIRFTVTTDPDVIMPTGATGGDVLPEDWTVTVQSIGEDHITLELSGTTPLPIPGQVATITYAVASGVRQGMASRVDLSDGLVNSGMPIPILTDGIAVVGEEILPYWSGLIVLKMGDERVDSASFGIHPLATDNFDRNLDRIDPPPVPDALGNIYFVSADGYRLVRDWRHLGDRDLVFPLVVTASGRLVWDPNRMWSGCSIGDTLDMKSVDGVDVHAGDTVYIYFHYRDPMAITVHLERGWNMVSVPFVGSGFDPHSLFPDMLGSFVFTYDQGDRTYYPVTTLQPERGYWIFNTRAGDYTISGSPLREFSADLQPGWYMIGSLAETVYWMEQTVDPEGSVMREIFLWYDPVAHSFVNPSTIEPGKAYWIFVTQPCHIDVSGIYVNP